jgi:CheY-like chemotaxis protein
MKPQVLVVEDAVADRALVAAILGTAGYLVLEAADGDHGLRLLRRAPQVRVVLVDYHMARLDGIAFLQAVATDPVLTAAHGYVLLTAARPPFPPALEALLHLLHAPVLYKPFTIRELMGCVEAVIQQQRAP